MEFGRVFVWLFGILSWLLVFGGGDGVCFGEFVVEGNVGVVFY